MNKTGLLDLIDKALIAKERLVEKQTAYIMCRTDWDRKQADKAEEAYDTAYEELQNFIDVVML